MNQEAQIRLGRRLLRNLKHPEESATGRITRNDLSAYVSQERFRLEVETLFRKSPIVAGFTCQLREPGDFVTDCGTGVPILLVRGRDGEARAFLNACRHRGAAVAEAPCGRGALHFACPYHGWVYDTEGRLVSIPEKDYGFEEADKETLALIPLPAAERHGMIWVLPDPSATLDLDACLGAMNDELAGYEFGNYTHFQTVTHTRPFNWKLVSDGFWEGYHVKVLHKRTIEPIFHSKTMVFDALGPHHRMALARKTIAALEGQPESDWDVISHAAILYSLFPNTIFVAQGDHVEITRIFPGARPEECLVHFSLFTPEPVIGERARGHWQRNMDLLLATVEEEDFRMAEGIQRAAAAGRMGYQVIGKYEPALAHFHQQIGQALGTAPA